MRVLKRTLAACLLVTCRHGAWTEGSEGAEQAFGSSYTPGYRYMCGTLKNFTVARGRKQRCFGPAPPTTDVAVPRSKRYCRDCTKRLVSHLLYGTTSKSWHRVFSRRQWHNLISFAVGSINGGFYNSIKPRCIPHFVNTLLFKKLVDSSRCAAMFLCWCMYVLTTAEQSPVESLIQADGIALSFASHSSWR